MNETNTVRAKRRDIDAFYDVRKMTNEEIHNPENKSFWVSEKTGHIFEEYELIFLTN